MTKNKHFENDELGVCFAISQKLETEYSNPRDLWVTLTNIYDPNIENKLGTLVNCFSRTFGKRLIPDIRAYDYSRSTMESVFKFMRQDIPVAVAYPIISNFLWMKYYPYDFYLKNIAKVLHLLSPSVFLYELRVARYDDLGPSLTSEVIRSQTANPMILDMLYLKLRTDPVTLQVSSVSEFKEENVQLSSIVSFISLYGTRVLSSVKWEKFSKLVLQNLHTFEVINNYDLARLIFTKVSPLLEKEKSFQPAQLIPIFKGIPSSFFNSGNLNDVVLDYLLKESTLSLQSLLPTTLTVLFQRRPISRQNLETFATSDQCHKYSVLSNIWYSEFQHFIVGDDSKLIFDKSQQSLIDGCKYSVTHLKPLDYAVRLRGFMVANRNFKITFKSVKLLENALSGILISDINDLSITDALDVINLITTHTSSYKQEKQLARAMASKAYEAVYSMGRFQFGIYERLNWRTIPSIYLSYFNSYMLRELPTSFFEITVPKTSLSKTDWTRCSEIVSKIGYSEDLKTHFSNAKASFFTRFYLTCVPDKFLDSKDLVTLGNLVCELPARAIRSLKPKDIKDYGYFFHDCCLSKSQGRALRDLARRAEMSYEDMYLSFGSAWLMALTPEEQSSKVPAFIGQNPTKRRVYYEQITGLLSRGTEMLHSDTQFCRQKLFSYDKMYMDKSLRNLFNSTYNRMKTLNSFKPFIPECHDDTYYFSPSCSMLKNFGESLKYASLEQLKEISECDFQNCLTQISNLKFLDLNQRQLIADRIAFLKTSRQFVNDMGPMVTMNTSNDIPLMSFINFTDLDQVAIHGYLDVWSPGQLHFGLNSYLTQNSIQRLDSLTALDINALGNFLCGLSLPDLVRQPNHPTIKYSLKTFSQLSLCTKEALRETVIHLEMMKFVKKPHDWNEFDVRDYGYLLAGFMVQDLNSIAAKKPHIIQYADKPFFNILRMSDLKSLNCSFWLALDSDLLLALPQFALADLSYQSQRCILRNIHSNFIPEESLSKVRGSFVEPAENEPDDVFIPNDPSNFLVPNAETEEPNSQLNPFKDFKNETQFIRITYIYMSHGKLWKPTIPFLSSLFFAFCLSRVQYV